MADPAYANRRQHRHSDGTLVFKTREDERKENAVAKILERAFDCTIHSYGSLAPVDYWAEKDGRIHGYFEIKCRSHESTRYPSVFLNVRKWCNLVNFSHTGYPSHFVVEFTDGVFCIDVHNIDPRDVVLGGTRARDGRNGYEPMINVPIAHMSRL